MNNKLSGFLKIAGMILVFSGILYIGISHGAKMLATIDQVLLLKIKFIDIISLAGHVGPLEYQTCPVFRCFLNVGAPNESIF